MKYHALLSRLRPALLLGLALGCIAAGAKAAPPTAALPVAAPPIAAPPFTIAMVLPRAPQSTEAGFRSYLERENVPVRYVEVRFSGNPSEAPALRQQVAALRPDLVYVWGTPTALALAGRHDQGRGANPLRSTPIVFTEVTDPVNAGLIRNLAQPGGNITGVSHVAPLDVQFNAIQAYRPFRRIGYLHNPAEPNSLTILRNLQAQARRQGLEVIEASLGETPDAAQIAPLVADIAARGADLLYIGPITFLAFTHRDVVTQAALRYRLPTFCATESIVRRSGCLFGLFSNDTNVGRYAGSMARQILVEKKPVGAIAASTLQRFSLLVNLPTAQALELYPPMLLLNVAEVIPATSNR
ncbi:MAG: ABC transporter substrate-binding protein [Comamonas sp.]